MKMASMGINLPSMMPPLASDTASAVNLTVVANVVTPTALFSIAEMKEKLLNFNGPNGGVVYGQFKTG